MWNDTIPCVLNCRYVALAKMQCALQTALQPSSLRNTQDCQCQLKSSFGDECQRRPMAIININMPVCRPTVTWLSILIGKIFKHLYFRDLLLVAHAWPHNHNANAMKKWHYLTLSVHKSLYALLWEQDIGQVCDWKLCFAPPSSGLGISHATISFLGTI